MRIDRTGSNCNMTNAIVGRRCEGCTITICYVAAKVHCAIGRAATCSTNVMFLWSVSELSPITELEKPLLIAPRH